MDIKRICRHLLMTHWQVNSAFPPAVRDAIAAAISASRAAHVGQVFFAVEGALHVSPLFKGQTAQQRALEVFSHLRVWDTEHNNGVLIYLLLADRAVEIVADRGVYSRVDAGEWGRICRQMEAAFKEKNYEAGVIAGIQSATRQLIQHFPASAS
ncbi:MAG TPA: TPM domain-containing protein [Steroidobacteraceae bacterium]